MSGNAIATISYDAYGNEGARSSNASSPFGFAGQYSDAESGYQYLRARYYDPSTGQFLTRDPIEALTRSAYGYVYGNPLNAIDPSGLWCITGVNREASERAGHQVCNGFKEVAKSTAVVMIDSTPVAPGCPVNVGQFRRVAAWQWSHPDQHADVMKWVGSGASLVAVGAAASGNAPVAGVASGVATIASGVEMVQGIRANEPEHIVVGGVGLVTAGFGAGASVMATGLGAGRVTQTIIAILELWIGAGSSELVDG